MAEKKKKKTEKPPTTKEVLFTKSLKCLLADEEKMEAAQALAANIDELRRLENEKEAMTKNFKGQIVEVEARVGVNTGLVRNGWDYRKVNCVRLLDFENNKVTVTRKDTGEVIEDRDMYADEKQQQMDFKD